MFNLEELKKCRVVYFLKGNYLVNSCGDKFINLSRGDEFKVCDEDYENVDYAYKTYNDFLNGKPYYSKNEVLLSDATKEWLRYIIRSLKNINFETLELEVCDSYCSINFRTNNGYYDGIVLPDYDFIIHDFSKLEKDKIYTFKELGIKL